MKFIAPILLTLLFCACEEGDKPSRGNSYEFVVGDTAITISADAVNFANNRFSWDAYMLREFQLGSSTTIPRGNGSAYTGTLIEWKNLPWSVRETYLFPPYTHDVTTESRELFYYLIGTHGEQFGYGWRDTFDPEANLFDSAVRPWLHPADSTLTPDNPGTISFDGGLGDLVEYRGMWEF